MSGYNSKKRKVSTRNTSGQPFNPTYGASTRGTGTASTRGTGTSGTGSNNTVPTLGRRPDNITSDGQNLGNPGFEELLAQYAGTSDLANSLLQLGVNDPDRFKLSGDDATTWNQQLLTILIQYMLTQEQRGYNEQLLNEGRLYDNPQNQLARLMGAGISRDAALQLLSGAGGSGTGGSLPYGDAATAPSMSDFAAMKEAHTQSFLGTWNASMNTINTIMSMVDFGLSVPQAIEQVNAMQMQNYMSREQMDAYKASKHVTGVAQNLVNSGAINYDDIQNGADLEQYLLSHKDDPGIQDLFKSGSFNGAFGTPYGRDILNKHWSQLRDSAHGGDLFGEHLKQQRLASIRAALDNSKIGKEMENIDADTMFKRAETEQAFAQICLINAQTANTDEATELLKYQEGLVSAQTQLVASQTTGQDWTNENLRMDYELNASGFPMLKQIYIDELTDKVNYWSTIGSPQVRQERIKRWLNNEQNLNHAAYLEQMRLNAVGDFHDKYYSLYMLSAGFNAVGGSSALSDMSNAGGTAIGAGSAVGKALKSIPKVIP